MHGKIYYSTNIHAYYKIYKLIVLLSIIVVTMNSRDYYEITGHLQNSAHYKTTL